MAKDRLPVLPHLTLIGFYTSVFGELLAYGAKRIATCDKVAAPLREPFAEYQGPAGAGEVDERPRGTGLQHAIGTLVTCEYCAGPWIASALLAALVARPRETRVVASMLAATAVSDFLHQSYTFLRKAS